MCEVMEQYSKKAVKKATKQANITAIKNMLEFKIPKESILKKYTESEYNTAIAELQSESRQPKTKTNQPQNPPITEPARQELALSLNHIYVQ